MMIKQAVLVLKTLPGALKNTAYLPEPTAYMPEPTAYIRLK